MGYTPFKMKGPSLYNSPNKKFKNVSKKVSKAMKDAEKGYSTLDAFNDEGKISKVDISNRMLDKEIERRKSGGKVGTVSSPGDEYMKKLNRKDRNVHYDPKNNIQYRTFHDKKNNMVYMHNRNALLGEKTVDHPKYGPQTTGEYKDITGKKGK